MGGSITEVAGILVGHAHDAVRGSGVTVLLFPEGAMAVADIRGEAAGTRQMDSLLRPHPVQKIHALVFAGGSAFGLDAASGVVRYLEARNVGFSTPGVWSLLFPRLSSTTWGMGIAPFGRIRRWGMRRHALRHPIPPSVVR